MSETETPPNAADDDLAGLNEQALALFQEQEYGEAAALQRQVMAGYERAYGKNDIRTMGAKKQLAVMMSSDGQMREAETMLRELLAAAREQWEDDDRTVSILQNLMGPLSQMGEHLEVAAVSAEIIAIKTRIYGAEHPETLQSLRFRAGQLYRADDFAGAEAIQRSLLEVRRRMQGQCLQTLLALRELVLPLTALEQFAEAETLGAELIAMARRVQGDTDRTTMVCIGNVAKLYVRQNKFEEAAVLQREIVDGAKRNFGNNDVETATALDNLARSLREKGDRKEAYKLQRKVIDIRRRVLGADHPDTIEAKDAL